MQLQALGVRSHFGLSPFRAQDDATDWDPGWKLIRQTGAGVPVLVLAIARSTMEYGSHLRIRLHDSRHGPRRREMARGVGTTDIGDT